MKDVPRRLSGVWGRMQKKTPPSPIFLLLPPPFSTSAAHHGLHVLAWWATTHVGKSPNTQKQRHTHTPPDQCVSSCVSLGVRELVLAGPQCTIRRLLSAKHQFNSPACDWPPCQSQWSRRRLILQPYDLPAPPAHNKLAHSRFRGQRCNCCTSQELWAAIEEIF